MIDDLDGLFLSSKFHECCASKKSRINSVIAIYNIPPSNRFYLLLFHNLLSNRLINHTSIAITTISGSFLKTDSATISWFIVDSTFTNSVSCMIETMNLSLLPLFFSFAHRSHALTMEHFFLL